MRRNELCSCGSGERYKRCCGGPGGRPPGVREEALAAHRAGALGQAEALYRQALGANEGDVDVCHMLGVVHMQRLRHREALETLWQAAEETGWAVAEIRHNVSLVLGKLLTREANARQEELLAEFMAWEESLPRAGGDLWPLVSVVLPTYNHEPYVAQAIGSVLAQDYPRLELIVIDDGSRDRTVDVARAALAGARVPVRFVVRGNRGAPATLNEGAALARGDYLAFLNSDDYYAPGRIACLVEEVARRGVRWGMSLVSSVQEGHGDAGEPRDIHRLSQLGYLGRASNSFALVSHNTSISTGNLFVERAFFQALGGFRDHRYNHDWDFCLRAAARAEPLVVRRPLYFYRLHDSNTINESRRKVKLDADRVLGDFIAAALSGTGAGANPLAPQWPANRAIMWRHLFSAGAGSLVPPMALRELAASLRRSHGPATVPAMGGAAAAGPRRTALVVLGMHRSGTSALARVLNLCGAFLPAKLRPPKLGNNPKGFWEPEDVVDLNERLLAQLGGSWDRVDFVLPESGAVAEDFHADAAALLAAEYGDRDPILIKDPRIGVLAPWWHGALEGVGYRPVYVVPVRHPLEVARSLHARGDMSVRQGLSLWLAYMKRIMAFADGRAEAVFIRFADLLNDWRGLVGQIGDGLDVRLDTRRAAPEVDAFLEPALRRQQADDDDLGAFPDDPELAEIRVLYQDLLGRCAARYGLEIPPGRLAETPVATASFVLCIENNAIRDQALLLCESIRRFGGRQRHAPILAFSPRPGLVIDGETRRRLADMDVQHVDEPLNTACPEYGSANRVVAAAWAEAHCASEFLVVLDSDTVFLEEPELPEDADVAVRPVDSKGSATRGPGDPFEDYWQALAALHGASLERLPFVATTIGGERVRASYNGGLIVARRAGGLLRRWAELFFRSVEAGMRPYRGSGMDIFASTGHVGRAASEYWGSNQAALAIAVWAATDRVFHYPACYNVPLHLVAADGEIDPAWSERPPVHLHYHWMFQPGHHAVGLELLARLGVPADRRDWLARRVPLGA